MKDREKIALVTMAKDEDLYLQEWIDYHLKLGFNDIYIYQNNWRFKNKKGENNVHFLEWDIDSKPHKNEDPVWSWNRHSMCYNSFGKKYYEKYEWAAFFDVDCFLVIKNSNDVKEFISKFDSLPQSHVVINFAMFGDGGNKEFSESNTSLLERFTKRWDKPHNHSYYSFLPICKLHKDFDRHCIHYIQGEEWIDVDMNVGSEMGSVLSRSRHVSYDKAQLNHYYTKTLPEWEIKCTKTRAEGDEYKNSIDSFHMNNFNDIEDLYALNFFKNKK